MLNAPWAGERSTKRMLLGVVTATLVACGANDPEALTRDGRAALEKQDYISAVIQFKAVLQKNPQAKEIRVLLAKALSRSGDVRGAIVELTRAQEQGASPEECVPLIANELLKTGDYKKIVNSYSATKLNTPDAQAALMTSLAAAWTGLGDKSKADAAAKAAIAASPQAGPVVLMQAQQLLKQRDVAGANALLDNLLAKGSASSEAWVLKGSLLASDPAAAKAAEAAFVKALEVDRSNVTAHVLLINQHLQGKDIPAARKQLEAFRAAQPKNAWVTFVSAEIAYSGGQYKEAGEITQKLLQVAADSPAILNLAGTVALQSGELSQAEIHFSKALQLAPDLQGARIGLASTYLRLYQPAKALAAIQPALTEGGVDGQALSLAGEAALALGDTPAAEMYFQRAAKLMPGDAAARTSLALTHMARGDTNKAFDELSRVASDTKDIVAEQAMYSARLRRGEFDAAMEAVDIIAKKQPSNANVHDLRGKIYLMKRDYLQARKAFETQLTQDPKSISASANLAAIDLIEKKPDEARKRLRAAIKSDPKNIYPMLALARLQLESGAPLEEIRQIYTDAILAQPGAREPRLELLSLTLRKRLYKEALTVAQEAAAALPSDSLVMDAVGRAQMEAGDVEQAITTFRRIAGSDTKSALPYTRLADIYLKTGKREQAEGALRKALEAEPDLIQAQVALIDLLVQGKRTSEALNLARQRQRDAPDKPAGYALEAALHVALKEMDQALASYQSGVAKTQSPPLALALHQLLTHLHRYDRADQFAAVWQRDHPKDLRFSFQVAESAISRGQLEDAYTRLTRLAQESPDDALVLNNLAAVMVQSGKSGALPIAQKAADLATGNIRILVLDTLASAFAQNGQLDKALATQKQALELAPEASNLRLGLARLALKGGDKALARQELTRLKALGAKFSQQEEVTRLLGSL